jgi:hypothetical protein
LWNEKHHAILTSCFRDFYHLMNGIHLLVDTRQRRSPNSAEVVPPSTALEAQLLPVFERSLRRSPVSVTSSFFALGGRRDVNRIPSYVFSQFSQFAHLCSQGIFRNEFDESNGP